MAGLLEGKVAVVTGAGSGVGRAAVALFVGNGAKVVAADIDGEGARRSIEAAGLGENDARAVACDVGDARSVTAAVEAAADAFGRLDVMYNNAGITVMPVAGQGLRGLVDLPEADMLRVEQVNINGVIFGCQAAIRQFDRQGGGGAIVNTASVAGLIGYGGVLYGATKGAVVALTRTLAIELAAKDIRVNAVCPAGMLTRYAGQDPEGPHREQMLERIGRAHPLGRAIDPADCAAAAMFLASDLARNITGVNLPVDGGLTAGRAIGR